MLSRTNLIVTLILSAFLLSTAYAEESSMKCEAGKCSSGSTSNTKKIPEKDIPSIAKKEASEKKKASKGPTGQKNDRIKATVKQLFNVNTVEVKRVSTAQEQVNYGYIVAQDSRMVDVVTKFDGFIERLYADTRYDYVEKGEALAKVYSPEIYQAKQDYLNSLNYNAKTSMPQMLKSAKLKLELLGVCQKEIAEIRKQHKANAYTTVFAPISGWIFEKNVNQGSSFNTKKKLFQIVNLDKVWMDAKLFQNELETVDQLDHFMVKAKGVKKTYMAQTSLLYPMLDPKEATVTLRLTIDNESQMLKPGMYAKLHASGLSQSRLVIPRTAAMRKNGLWYAFLATEFQGEYEPVQIEVKPLDDKHFEVLSGLKENEMIVNNALFMMDSDAQINGIY